MADTTSIRCINFGDIVSICQNRANIKGAIQDADLNFIKGAINESYVNIATERNWYWRKFDRDITFNAAVTTGTVSVVNNSRAIVFTGLTLDNTFVGRSFRVFGDFVLYRIIGVNIPSNTAYLASSYAGVTNATATFKIYQYEFPLPPDADTVSMVYFEVISDYYGKGNGELEQLNVLEFNRIISRDIDFASVPMFYNIDGKISAESLPPLDVMLLDYDFLGGDPFSQVHKLRIYPLQPDIPRVIHINYSLMVEPMVDDKDEPLMPVDNRWILVHFALAEWYKDRGQLTMSDRELRDGTRLLKEMRAEHHKTDIKPKFVPNKSRYLRRHFYKTYYDIFLSSRILEYGSSK